MSQEPEIMNGGESPLAHKLAAESASAQRHQSSATQSDGGPAPTSGSVEASRSLLSSEEPLDASGVATSGGIMRPRSGQSSS